MIWLICDFVPFYAHVHTVVVLTILTRNKRRISILNQQARSQDLEKGGYFERVRSVQTTLIRIFINLESVSDGLSETWSEMSRKARKFKAFFRPKLGDLQKKKKKKGLRQNSEWFFGRNPKFKGFFRPKLGDLQKKKKKKVFTKIEAAISSNFANSDVGLFSNGGGYFPFFT